MKIIIHCDDIGFTCNITRRILNAWKDCLIGSFSILANGDAIEEITRELELESKRHARIAVHLNLSEGKSVTSPGEIPLIVDSEGRLNSTFIGLIFKWVFNSSKGRKCLLEQIEKEFKAQISIVKKICGSRQVNSIDGHVHFHMLPFLFPLAAKVAKEQGIPEIRISREIFYLSTKIKDSLSFDFIINIIKYIILQICAFRARAAAKQYGITVNDSIVGILYTGRMTCAAAKAGIRAAERKGAKTIEVLFHIGRAVKDELTNWYSDAKYSRFPLNEKRDKEYLELIKLREEI